MEICKNFDLKKNTNYFSARGNMVIRYSAVLYAFLSSYEKECLMLLSLVLSISPA